jgi:hypothetical protein
MVAKPESLENAGCSSTDHGGGKRRILAIKLNLVVLWFLSRKRALDGMRGDGVAAASWDDGLSAANRREKR